MLDLLESVVVNGSVRREFGDDGREYLIAPVSLLVPGVLSGSKGALYYPPDEVAKNASAWEGMPLTVGHPRVAGQPVSAKHSQAKHVGKVRAPGVRNGNLRAEGWFDVQALQYEDPGLLRRLERGERIEVSTGLFTSNEPAPPGASYNGRPYDAIARDYRPDHLAILPDEQGACSLRDGCGVNNQSPDYLSPQENDMEPTLNDAERKQVMPTVNCDCVPTNNDDDDDDRLPPPPKKVNTHSPVVNEQALNAILFENNWVN